MSSSSVPSAALLSRNAVSARTGVRLGADIWKSGRSGVLLDCQPDTRAGGQACLSRDRVRCGRPGATWRPR
jgi:hypothetical protein